MVATGAVPVGVTGVVVVELPEVPLQAARTARAVAYMNVAENLLIF
jgi:hypothetical protein